MNDQLPARFTFRPGDPGYTGNWPASRPVSRSGPG